LNQQFTLKKMGLDSLFFVLLVVQAKHKELIFAHENSSLNNTDLE